MKPIHEFLGLSAQEHQDDLMRIWMNWTENNARDAAHWQNLLANRALNRWFWAEMDKLERQFVATVSRYEDSGTITAVDYRRCYHRTTVHIFEIYPKGIVEAAKVRKPSEVTVTGQRTLPITYLNSN